MGRVSRYKKIKAIDPFSKASAAPKEETTSKDANRPPSKRETAYIPRKMREMMQFKEKLSGKSVAARPSGSAAGGPTGAESSKAPNQRYFKHVEPLPGESMKSFSRRVKVEMRKRLTEIKTATPAAEAKRMSEGRKAHLDARAEAKRRRKLGLPADAPLPEAHGGSADADEPPQVSGGKRKRAADGGGGAAGEAPAGPSAAKRARQAEGDAAASAAAGAGAGAAAAAAGGGSKGALRLGRTTAGGGAKAAAAAGRGVDKEDFPTDVVRFGERAERPPDLKVAPRKSKKQRDAEALHAARRAVAFGGEDAYTERAQAVVDAADAADASAREAVRKEALAKAQMERLRAEAMSAYDALKKRRNEAFVAASAAAAASNSSGGGAGKAGSRAGSGGGAAGTFGGGKAKKAAMAAARRIDSDLLPPPATGGRVGALKAGPTS